MPRAFYEKHRIPIDYHQNIYGPFNPKPQDIFIHEDSSQSIRLVNLVSTRPAKQPSSLAGVAGPQAQARVYVHVFLQPDLSK